MALNPRVLGLIPARAGSQRLPGKNSLVAHGQPLIAWTLQAALQADCLDRVVVSTDDPAIMALTKQYGGEAPFQRPAELATSEASSMDVVLHALDQLPGYDWVMLLQPTSPQRQAQDITNAWALAQQHAALACVSVCPGAGAGRFDITPDQRLYPIDTEESTAPVYGLNGAIYLARTDWLRATRHFVSPETLAYVMPLERSLDIDTAADFERFIRNTAPHAVPEPKTH